jgi:heat shock protein HtpX
MVASLLGVNRFLTANGLNLGALLGFALVMGFGGAIISLLISKPMAKWTAGVQIIDAARAARRAWIVETVRKFADKAGIGMPEVGIYEGDAQRLCHRRVQELGAGGRVHRPAAEA